MEHEILVYNKTRKKISKKFIEDVILRALNFLKLKQPIELAVLVIDKGEIKRLNKIWRRKNKVVDELSFGLNSRKRSNLPAGRQEFAKKQNEVLELGEIIINADKISEKNNLSKILIHSLLHLLGYNHEKSATEAQKMEHLEVKIFKYLSIGLEIRN
ncbi:MAG: rRNA maturation RNase YbeY [Parcubacteria group bacterium]|nr:rRNA maturation RNase YbeY [Parcubacteria group bacterium]